MPEPTLKTISFAGTCSANSEQTLVSPQISTPYMVRDITASFALNTNRLLQLDFYISPDPSDPSSGRPSGVSLMREYGQVEYIVGDNEQKFIKHETMMATHPSWLKVYANNTDFYDHTIDVIMTIEILTRE